MKIRIDIDCTPEEARTFLGLPDVGPMQSAILDEVKERLMENLSAVTPDQLLKTWVPSFEGWDKLQRTFWAQAGKKDEGEV